MYVPNHDKIFADLDYCDTCESLSCSQIYSHPKSETAMCQCVESALCPRVSMIADEIRQFIGNNDDIFMYIMPIGE